MRDSYLAGVDASVATDDDVEAFFAEEQPEAVVERALAEAPTPALSSLLKSEIASVSPQAWTEFVQAMRTAAVDSVSGSNALGAWEMKPRRLADLGLMKNLTSGRNALGFMAYDGEFQEPLTKKKFLENPGVQYRVFAASMRRYVDGLMDGSVKKPEQPTEGMTLSGALAILHRCGPGGLLKWSDESERFSDTNDLYNRVNGLF